MTWGGERSDLVVGALVSYRGVESWGQLGSCRGVESWGQLGI